jgi:valyl-tRNA synthetase
VVSEDQELLDGFRMLEDAVLRLAKASDFTVQQDKAGIPQDAMSVVIPDATAYLPLEDMIDFDQEIERLTKEEARLTKEIARSNGMLGNEKFISKAPAAKVQEEREKLEKYEQMMAQVKDRLASLRAKMA